ncbi:MAG: penicillin-binding protein activator LpoB [Candidatus Omnitrophica bacterium]|nr:penicillin-binding protein activator LpoB [Candidatus Omnitrophota bacterium]
MNKTIVGLCVLGVLGVCIGGCGKPVVKRTSVEQTIDLSGVWNDTDSRLVAEEMIKDCMNRPWINRFSERAQREPVVIVGTVVNRSHEHINAQLFTKDLEQSLINSNLVKVVASKQEREEVREERQNQQVGLTEQETVKAFGHETGADFMLQGTVNSVKDEIKGKYVMLYQVTLELVDLKSNEKVWLGKKEIKKYVKRSAFGL